LNNTAKNHKPEINVVKRKEPKYFSSRVSPKAEPADAIEPPDR